MIVQFRKVAPILILLILGISNFGYSWGFWAHKRINRLAVFTLPPEMITFFKRHIEHLTEHAVDPDKRRYAIKGEAPKHYIDLDHFCTFPCEDFPKTWDSAVATFSEDTLLAYGTVPWSIQETMNKLTKAFEIKDKFQILKYASDLGHYVGDMHVPLHTTENYNGQLTNQKGIHGFWESREPELFGESYDYFVGKAVYLDETLNNSWDVVMQSHAAVDSVLTFESDLTGKFPSDQKFSYERRGETTVRVYSEEFSTEYHEMLNNMVERRMRASIIGVGSYWFTCWVNAGQPDLNEVEDREFTDEEKAEMKAEADKPEKPEEDKPKDKNKTN